MKDKKIQTKPKGQKKKIQMNKKLVIMIVVALLIVIGIVVGMNRFMAYLEQKQYAPYETKMNQYGFSKLYNNGIAKNGESVSKSEALKVLIGATFNIYDITSLSNEPTDTYPNARWVLYAEEKDMMDSATINTKNENKKATKGEVIAWLAAAKEELLHKKLDNADNVSYSNYQKLDSQQQTAIADALANGILTNEKSKFSKDANIKKGELNKWIVEYVEKYQTILLPGSEIETDSTKFPSNVSEYPYIAKGIDKSVYELPFIGAESNKFASPAATYIAKKENYRQISDKIQQYFNVILNINYQTITEESFQAAIDSCLVYPLKEQEVKDYVNYVKLHKIVIEGKATVQLPIVYELDSIYYARTKLEFSVTNGDTNQNLLFKDASAGTITYADKQYQVYIDANLGLMLMSKSLGIKDMDIYHMLLNKQNTTIKGGI